MKKLDNKGFALAETLVVSVFVLTIFTLIFTNFYPLMAEYEKREVYDDIDGKYAAYWIKKIVEDDETDFDKNLKGNSYLRLTNNDSSEVTIGDPYMKVLYERVFKSAQIENVYLIDCKTSTFTDFVKDNETFNSTLEDYMNYLPTYEKRCYSTDKPELPNYRVIIEFHRTTRKIEEGIDDTGNDFDYYAYSTMEVKK